MQYIQGCRAWRQPEGCREDDERPGAPARFGVVGVLERGGELAAYEPRPGNLEIRDSTREVLTHESGTTS